MLDETHADCSLLQNGAVNLFWRKELFEKSLNELRKLGYALIWIRFESMESFLVQLSEGLRWHDQFGYAPWTGNLDALNDSLRDQPAFSPSGCLAICIEDFDKLVSADREFAWKLLARMGGTSFHPHVAKLIPVPVPAGVR